MAMFQIDRRIRVDYSLINYRIIADGQDQSKLTDLVKIWDRGIYNKNKNNKKPSSSNPNKTLFFLPP